MSEKHAQDPHLHKFPIVCIAILILALFCIMLSQAPWSGSSIRDTYGTVGYQENPWVLRQGDTVLNDHLVLPEYMPLEHGKLYTLTTLMTFDGTSAAMPYGYIHLDHAYCRVLLDGKVLFSCMPEDLDKWDASKSPGFIYKAFPLPRDCLGKELEVQVLPPMTLPMEYGLPELQFSDFMSSLHTVIVRDMPHNVVTILCILMGIAAILFSTVTLSGSDYREGISIGIFALLFSLYLITECRTNAYFIGNPYYHYILNYISFSLLPVSLMGFMRERLPDRYGKLCSAVIWAESLFFLLEAALHFSGVIDMKEILPVVHVIYFAEMALVTVLLRTMQDKKRRRSLIFQITPALIGMLMDAMIYWLHWQIGQNDATFTILGVIIFLMIELIHVWKTSISIYTESVRSSLYRQMAYVDGLTGVENRRAFDQEIEAIASGKKDFHHMIVVSADVNRLKYVNDHYGHAAGDKLIRSAARIMSEGVADHGKVFRTGGDEFAAFLYDTDMVEYERIGQKIVSRIETFNAEHDFELSLAVGYVQLADHRILEAVQEADQRMYTNKQQQKMARDQQPELSCPYEPKT